MMRIGKKTVVVITGASGGVGRATARLLGERGAKVVLLARGARAWKVRSAKSSRAAARRLRCRRMSANSSRCEPPRTPPNASSGRSTCGSTTRWSRCTALS